MDHAPDLDRALDGRSPGPDSDLQRVRDMLVRAGPLPELPDALARPPAVARPER